MPMTADPLQHPCAPLKASFGKSKKDHQQSQHQKTPELVRLHPAIRQIVEAAHEYEVRRRPQVPQKRIAGQQELEHHFVPLQQLLRLALAKLPWILFARGRDDFHLQSRQSRKDVHWVRSHVPRRCLLLPLSSAQMLQSKVHRLP